ncbi:sensor histidine kinase [Ectobacillus ponti]|uniref:Oxygen sensor histidine kinase NreB n=1 Tax=Ectobacillus ponti TaxID=2961894 RepID=A0AA42BP28_9BACI|nr:sensor histidine kinase [Ectobacillus ponti]MCP8967976.1 sensor histidine kinase [Ectobacillus ponti]
MAGKKWRLFPEKYGYFPLFWLIYLAFPVHYLQLEPPLKMVAGYAMLAVFLVVYRQLYYAEKWYVPLVLLQMLIVYIFVFAYDPNYMYMGFYASNFIGMIKSRRQFISLLAVLALGNALSMFFALDRLNQDDLWNLMPPVILSLLFPFATQAAMKQQELRRQLNEANAQIEVLVKREERQRIARDLHDTLGHTLSLIALKSQLIEKLAVRDAARAQQEAREVGKTARSALRQVRELISDMRAVTIPEEMVQVRAILEAAGISLSCEVEERPLPPLMQNILGMCLREAVTNVVKHSRADHCSISLKEAGGEIVMEVRDNGRGLAESDGSGNGLKGIEERLALLEGRAAFQFTGKGTTVRIALPLVIKQKQEVAT